MSLEAQNRGYKLFHYTPDQLSMRNGEIEAVAEPMILRDVEGDHFELGPQEKINLADMDVVLLRQDPPFDMAYITSTHLLERVHPKTLVVNDPAWVRNSPEKIFVTEFPDLMPKTLISRDPAAINAFRAEVGDMILKPLYGNGGAGVFHIKPDDRNMSSLLEMFAQMYREPFIAQEYLSRVRAGDKRIILIDGEPVGAINRVPAEHDSRSNMHVGGRAEHSELTEREHEICARIGPALKGARLHPGRHRHHRRPDDRNQRDLAHRPARDPQFRRSGRGRAVLGRGRKQAGVKRARKRPALAPPPRPVMPCANRLEGRLRHLPGRSAMFLLYNPAQPRSPLKCNCCQIVLVLLRIPCFTGIDRA